MDAGESSGPPTGKPSPRSGLVGTRPPPLTVSKASHKIVKSDRKPPAGPAPHARAPPPQQQQEQPHPFHRPPVIIYDASPKVIHTNPSNFMDLVQRLTGFNSSSSSSSSAAADPGGGGALSPAARLATIEKSVRDSDHHAGPAQRSHQVVEIDDDEGLGLPAPLDRPGGSFPGILSPNPASLPPISPGFFSPLPFDPSILNELLMSPALGGATAGAGWGGGVPNFGAGLLSPGNLLSTPVAPSPGFYLDIFTQFPDL